MHPNKLQEFTSVYSNFESWMIGMAGNHLLDNMNWSDLVLKNSNELSPRPAASYFQTKHDDKVGYMGMNILLKSINKGSATCNIYQILAPSKIHNPFLNSYFTQ